MRYFPFISRAPSFEDEDKSRAAALLHFILVSTSLANIAAILARPFLPAGQTLGPVSANIFIQLVLIALFFLMWKGQVRLAGFILTAFMWMLLSLGAYANSGILNPIFGAQTVVIVMAGLLIGEAAGLGFAVFSSAFGWWLVQLAETGKYPGEMGSITTQVTWMNDTTAFVLTGLMLFLSLRTIREARKQTAQHTRSRRYSDERYRALVENAPDTIFTLDQQHRISYLSRSTLAPVETLIGKAVYDFLHPDSRDAYRAAVSRVLELGSVEQIEVQNLRPGEQSSWYSVRFAPIREAGKVIEVTAISTDITNHKLADTALRSSEERYHHALDSLLEGAQIIGFDWRYLYVNDTVAGHGREAKERLLRSTMIEVYPGIENTPMFATLRTCMEERTAQQIENEFVYPDGSKAWFELSVQPVPEGIFILSLDVTERKRSEAALRESEARLRGRIESAMDAIITIDESQHIVEFNAAAEKMFRYSADDIIGQPLITLIPERFRAGHGEHIRSFGETGVTNRHMGALGAISGLRANGEEFPIEASISQVDVGTGKFYTVILRDITERKQAEESIRSSEELFSTIVQSVPVAINIISLTNGRTLNVSDYMLKITGYDESEIVGRPIAEAPYWVKPSQWDTLSQPVRAGLPVSGVEMEWRTKSGEILTMLGSALQVDIHGEMCILGIALNITERKQAEKIRLEVYTERELLKVKENFISRMSHEFRTPLSVILTANDLLRRYYERMPTERREEHFNNVEKQIKYATALLDDVLTLSKERAGKMPFSPVRMNLVKFCEKLFEQMQTTDTGQHEYRFVADPEIKDMEGDEKLLQHILINLLSNAIKYSPEGGEVRFELRREADMAVIQISDQGIGIPEKDQKHLFEPFYRASNTLTIKGTGLGLAIVKESVDTHRGQIRCESAAGQGTTFVIHLPIVAEKPKP